MNLRKIITIYKKELLDLIRDRRTVITAFVIPIVLYPFIMIIFSSMAVRQTGKLHQQQSVVSCLDNLHSESSRNFVSKLKEIENLQLIENENIALKTTYLELLEENSIHALVVISDTLSSSGNRLLKVDLYYTDADEKSTLVKKELKEKIAEIKDDIVNKRLQAHNIDPELLQAVQLSEDNIASTEQMMGFNLGKFLPYILIILTLTGASVVASDLVAGEKERGTLETILVSAASRLELVIGKYLTIITISIITVLLNLFSLFLSFQYIFTQNAGARSVNFQLPVGNFFLILLLMLPLITFFSAVLLSISSYSRNIKEAQSYQMPILFGTMILSMISMLPAFELSFGFALIPIVNFSLLLRDIMMGSFNLFYYMTAIVSFLILDAVAIFISIKMFNNEAVLFRTADDKSLKFWGKEKKNILSSQTAVLFFLVVLFARFYLGNKWQLQDLMNGLIKTELLLILLPTIFILRTAKADLKKVLRINTTKPVFFLYALLGFVPVFIISTTLVQIINFIYPFPPEYIENLSKLIDMPDAGLGMSLLVIAVLPAICEEVMFRGFILSAFREKKFWSAVIITAVLFGIMHLDPFRMLPVTLSGIWLGYLLLKTNSIFIPVFAHFLNNAFALIIARNESYIEQYTNLPQLIIWLVVPSLFVIYLIYKKIEQQE